MSAAVASDQVVFTDFDGREGILVDLNSKKYYQINETAMLVWKSLEQGKEIDQIVNEVVAAYDVSPEHATASVERLLESMRRYKLVT
jgi:hypothetical protein